MSALAFLEWMSSWARWRSAAETVPSVVPADSVLSVSRLRSVNPCQPRAASHPADGRSPAPAGRIGTSPARWRATRPSTSA